MANTKYGYVIGDNEGINAIGEGVKGMARKVDVTQKMGAAEGDNLAQEGELTDAAVLHLNVTEAFEPLLIHVL